MSDDNGCTNEWHHQAHESGARCPECNKYGPWEARDDNGHAVDAVPEWEIAVHAYAEAVANAGKVRGQPPQMLDKWNAVRAAVERAIAQARVQGRTDEAKARDGAVWAIKYSAQIGKNERQRGGPQYEPLPPLSDAERALMKQRDIR